MKPNYECYDYIVNETNYFQSFRNPDSGVISSFASQDNWMNAESAGKYCCQVEKTLAYPVLKYTRHISPFGIDIGPLLFTFVSNCLFSVVSFQFMMCACVQNRSKHCRHLG